MALVIIRLGEMTSGFEANDDDDVDDDDKFHFRTCKGKVVPVKSTTS
jgi:hypothetical protein